MNEQYLTQIETLKKQIRDLETQLLTAEVKVDVYMEVFKKKDAFIYGLQERIQWLENRNKQLENPKGSHYDSLSWQGKIIFCIKKLRRPLRLQEIVQELEIMDAKTKLMKYQGDNFISVTLTKAVKAARLHIEKVRGTRGAYYALPEWLNEEGQLPEKMRRNML